ncbi:hypothetical protein CLV84_2656 [Neolewinella xylanilytica]|uniref:Lipoprotein n=1 Tax=Neolewinella xylanilytica TaxID=1514080 RepID=A0A2S6I3J1_9BACT|nr:hypothetical protein [Neolewinella xylanilytica]PPK85752.1 hypothetical protein CLV84_2656 [Neolewinella xylanilytica]
MFKALLLACLFLTCSCVGPARYGDYLAEYQPEDGVVAAPVSAIDVRYADDYRSEPEVKRIKNSFVPAILYWSWNNTLECSLDPAKQLAYVREGVMQAADSLGLDRKLAGQQLSITLSQVPGQFYYVNRMYVVIAIVAYSTMGEESITPVPTDLVASYAVTDGSDRRSAWGSSTVFSREEPMRNLWKSTRGFTGKFLDSQRAELQRMGRELVNDIDRELYPVSRK